MDKSEKNRLIDGWITLQELEEDSPSYEDNFWAFERLKEVCTNDPELCWEVILGILERNLSYKVMAVLAAGPTEDLLALHGPDFIEKVEVQAAQDEKFRRLLGGVWQNLMTDEIWKRVQAVAGDRW